MSQHEVTLLLGSNLGNTETNINLALIQLQNNVGEIVKTSTFLHSEAVEFASTNIFYLTTVTVTFDLHIENFNLARNF